MNAFVFLSKKKKKKIYGDVTVMKTLEENIPFMKTFVTMYKKIFLSDLGVKCDRFIVFVLITHHICTLLK